MPESLPGDQPPLAEIQPRRFSGGGEFAAFCAMAAPWLGAAWASLVVLVPPPEGIEPFLPQASGFSWLQCAATFAAAFFMWKMIRSGLRYGRLAPFRFLTVTALPWALGLLLTPIALVQVWYFDIMQGASIDVIVEPTLAPRLTGLLLSSQLLGAAGFALAVAGFLWRSQGRRWPGVWRTLAALAPFMAFVVVWMALDRFATLPLRAEWIGFALLTLPLRYALAGAVVTRPQAADPGAEWALAVPLAGTVLFMAAATLHIDQSLVTGFFAISAADGAEAWPMFTRALASAAAFALIGWALILVPEGMLLARHHGAGGRLRHAAIGHARIILVAGGLVLLESLANWHVVATIRDAVFAQPWSQQQQAQSDADSGDPGYAPPPPPRQATRPRPIEVPDLAPEEDIPPDLNLGLEPDPGPESPHTDAPLPVIFIELAQRAIRKPEFPFSEHLQSQMRLRNQARVVIVMKLVVAEDGSVRDVILQKGSGLPDLDEAARRAGWEWQFRPYLINGKPTEVASPWVIIYQAQ